MAPAVFELIKTDLAAERVAMDAQDARSARLVAVRAVQRTLDEFLLEFGDCFVKENAAIHHLADESFKLIFHLRTLRRNTLFVAPTQASSWPVNFR